MIALPPTRRFRCFHGNYCGPGNRGGVPIDCLDEVCYSHDYHYELSYTKDRREKLLRQRKADVRLIRASLRIASDASMSRVVRLKALIVASVFLCRTFLRNKP